MNNSRNDNLLIIGFVFLINPLIGIILASFNACVSRKRLDVGGLMVFVMLYLGALNTTKVPYSDMISYLEMYNEVPKNGFIGTLAFQSANGDLKDITYGSLTFLLYYITFGNQYLFIFIITLLGYWFMFASLFKFSKEYKFSNYIVVSQVLVLAFFTQYFSMTFHLVRQILATSIFFYALTFRKGSFKKFIFWSMVAVSTHSAVAILILFSFIPFMKRRLRIWELSLLIIFCASSMLLLSSFAASFLQYLSLQGEVATNLDRVANMEGMTDTTEGLGQTFIIGLSMFFMFLGLVEMWKKDKMAYPIVINLGLFLSFLIPSLAASPLIQYRFAFFFYSFLPFFLPIFTREKVAVSKVLCLTMVAFLMIGFYISLNNNVFQYAPTGKALFYPFFLLIKLF